MSPGIITAFGKEAVIVTRRGSAPGSLRCQFQAAYREAVIMGLERIVTALYSSPMALLSGANKIFVLDTNVILHDHDCIYSFEEHNVVIPITVLEEIDKFKKGNEIINFNAREFSRKLDAMGGDKLLNEGIRLESGGIVVVESNSKRDELLGEIFWEDKPDHRIISLAFNLAKEYGKERVILVSKDINIRMKAKSIGIKAEDYETGKILNIDELYKGKDILELGKGFMHIVSQREDVEIPYHRILLIEVGGQVKYKKRGA